MTDEFPVFSIKQPKAWAILKKRLTVLNRSTDFPSRFKGRWLALHCSSVFELEESFREMPAPAELQKQCGKILGIVKFGERLDYEEAKEKNPEFAEFLEPNGFHILVQDVVRLKVPQTYNLGKTKFPNHICNQKSIIIQLQELVEKAQRSRNQFQDDSSDWSGSEDEDTEDLDLDFMQEDEMPRASDSRLLGSIPLYKEERKIDRENVARELGNLTDKQMKRFESMTRSTIDRRLVARIMAEILEVPPKDIHKEILICVSGVAKCLLAELVEESIMVQVSQPDYASRMREYNPLRPSHIREGLRRIKKKKRYSGAL